jgi:hypothetical protein
MVVLRGKDLQFWAGQYGGKFAAPELKFIKREQLQDAQLDHGKPRKLVDPEEAHASLAGDRRIVRLTSLS